MYVYGVFRVFDDGISKFKELVTLYSSNSVAVGMCKSFNESCVCPDLIVYVVEKHHVLD